MKVKNILETFSSAILGILLFFYGLFLLTSGSDAAQTITMGVIALVLGTGYLVVTLFENLKLQQKGILLFDEIYSIGAILIYLFVVGLLTVISLGENNITNATAWIMYITLLVATLSSLIFVILSVFLKNDLFRKIRNVSLLVALGMELLGFIFSVYAGLVTIGDLSVYGIIIFALFAFLVINVLKGNGKQVEDSPKEEPEIKESSKEEKVEE